MAQLKESLSNDILENIKLKRNEVSNLVMELGQISLRSREIKNELTNLEEIKESIETRFDAVDVEIKSILSELEVKYPKGEIDLNEGVVYYESAE